MVKVKEVAVGTMTHIKDMAMLVIAMNKELLDEETYEEVLSNEGTHTLCGANITVTNDSMTVVKDNINLVIPLSEANKYEALQEVIYAELLQFLARVTLLYDKDGNERCSDVYSWCDYAVQLLDLMQEEQA